ncbi:molybdopterin molybdotransferase MoeA [Halomonas llamarensis]|uniref:Molybdopterin molybdenumtransferase n=1 Tax=Halomonas llamarensis TaxID=2945104 RepID=A0ABT0SNE3_9GAMM|nr:gephyrin-like molybdotransferase Glp [Halomonas llamarensis]MCL7929312.1 molybdopterin molybdotransferase MoeA [Halomonas llamarensis]
MSCCAGSISSPLLDFFDARERMVAAARPVSCNEKVELSQAVGRVLVDDVFATLDMPGIDNSAMDGYALRLNEICEDGLPVELRVPAGAEVLSLPAMSCARIFTGAPVPLGADVVIPQERVRLDADERVHIEGEFAKGANIRRRGEDTCEGDILLSAGTRLNAAAIALLASHGMGEVDVLRRLKVALISTGNELIEPGATRVPGQVYDSNRAMLKALLMQSSCDVLDLGVTADSVTELQQTFTQARDEADLVVCTGGISVGEEDHARPVLERLGGVSFHGVAIKPGKPFTLGYLGDSPEAGIPFVGLPCNPVASLVGWQLLALPLVHGCQGRIPAELQQFPVAAGFSRQGPQGRRELLRVVLD